MATIEGAAPAGPAALSTPDTHIFEQDVGAAQITKDLPRPSDEQLYDTYEIERTVREIQDGRWHRVALQFPDHMLVDAPFVVRALSRGLKEAKRVGRRRGSVPSADHEITRGDLPVQKLFILADTSYGACCVDEVAAEHADADVVVHYGRSCLSATARLPVIYVFTRPSFNIEPCVQAFEQLHSNQQSKIILMADIPFSHHLPEVYAILTEKGYSNLYLTSIVHNASSPLPNRTVPEEVVDDASALSEWTLFHISEPPQALLLTLASHLKAIHIFSVSHHSAGEVDSSSKIALRRRYALLTSLTTIPVFGILINTLSVRNYMSILNHVKGIIAAAGKKSYTFVVGKVNPAKIANFSEVGGWVVIGCWESSLFESKDFWKPLITPFELELTLKSDNERLWTGQWTSDFQKVLDASAGEAEADTVPRVMINGDDQRSSEASPASATSSDEESEPPEFDLRTGRYVSHSRPMGHGKAGRQRVAQTSKGDAMTGALTHRPKGDVANIHGVPSPAAEHLRDGRTWQGLGSDFEASPLVENKDGKFRGAPMEEGRHGIARAYSSADSKTAS
ncbi:MAG: Diphthamide biosynthesis protein 2 [Chrysothrix sp. TS-e1954]|nr:MAG: Diphthamide biosynthesis protein 2 [Chrysothrix sp. TS-e1954]